MQKTLAELEGRCVGSSGMQPARASNGRDGEASQRYFAGRRVGLNDVRASSPEVKHRIEPRFDPPERSDTGMLSGLLGCVALSCGNNGDSFRPDEVPRRLCPKFEQSKRSL